MSSPTCPTWADCYCALESHSRCAPEVLRRHICCTPSLPSPWPQQFGGSGCSVQRQDQACTTLVLQLCKQPDTRQDVQAARGQLHVDGCGLEKPFNVVLCRGLARPRGSCLRAPLLQVAVMECAAQRFMAGAQEGPQCTGGWTNASVMMVLLFLPVRKDQCSFSPGIQRSQGWYDDHRNGKGRSCKVLLEMCFIC